MSVDDLFSGKSQPITEKITEDIKQKARGLIIQRGLAAKNHYNDMTNGELYKLFHLQVYNHISCGVSSSDNVELFVTKGLLIERGFEWLVEAVYQKAEENRKEWESARQHNVSLGYEFGWFKMKGDDVK